MHVLNYVTNYIHIHCYVIVKISYHEVVRLADIRYREQTFLPDIFHSMRHEYIHCTHAFPGKFTAIPYDSNAIQDDFIAIQEDFIAIEDDFIAIQDDFIAIQDDFIAIQDDFIAIQDDFIAIQYDQNLEQVEGI